MSCNMVFNSKLYHARASAAGVRKKRSSFETLIRGGGGGCWAGGEGRREGRRGGVLESPNSLRLDQPSQIGSSLHLRMGYNQFSMSSSTDFPASWDIRTYGPPSAIT